MKFRRECETKTGRKLLLRSLTPADAEEALAVCRKTAGETAFMLRGENEILRAELQVKNGVNDALLQDNATLFRLNAKLMRQNTETNARADRMHDQVLSMLTEIRELREKLAAMCVDTREPVLAYQNYEQEPTIEISPEEQQITQKYEQMDLGDLFAAK